MFGPRQDDYSLVAIATKPLTPAYAVQAVVRQRNVHQFSAFSLEKALLQLVQ